VLTTSLVLTLRTWRARFANEPSMPVVGAVPAGRRVAVATVQQASIVE
jgi:hypothetical protein